MARHLASIYATEKDRVNCPFYLKIGSCRHGDRCSRRHTRPAASQTILITGLYTNPVLSAPIGVDGLPMPINIDEKIAQFEDFFEDVFHEMAKFGEIEEMHVVDNLGDHLVGNVYVKFFEEDSANNAIRGLQGRFYWGRAIQVELCPVVDFKQASCRQQVENECRFGGQCNYLHIIPPDRDLAKRTYGRQKKRLRDERATAGAEGGAVPNGGGRAPEGSDLELLDRVRAGSEERRAMFASWNAEGNTAGGNNRGAGDESFPPPPPSPPPSTAPAEEGVGGGVHAAALAAAAAAAAALNATLGSGGGAGEEDHPLPPPPPM